MRPARSTPSLTLQYCSANLAFAPNGLPADACPEARFEVRKKLTQVSFVNSFADEATDGVRLSTGSAGAVAIYLFERLLDQADMPSPLSHPAKIDIEWAFSIQGPQAADSIAQPGEESPKISTVAAFQFRGSQKLNHHSSDAFFPGIEAKSDALCFYPGMVKKVHREGDFISGPKAAAIQIASSQDIGPGRIFKPTGKGTGRRKEVLVQLRPLLKQLSPKLPADQIRCTIGTKRNRALRYQPKLGNEELEFRK